MEELLKDQKTLVLSTLSGEGVPKVSYSPYVFIDGEFYIYISAIADHYENMLNNPNLSIMILEDEAKSRVLFARKRAYFNGKAERVQSDERVFEKLSEIHGKEMVQMLRKIDMDLFKITVDKGRLVEGFGQAYDITYNNGIWEKIHVDETGHYRKSN